MIIKTYFDKQNTIVEGSKLNVGLNPITEITYGNGYSRHLFHFDLSRIKYFINDGTFPYNEYLKHRLKFTNCGSINDIDKMLKYHGMERATSFDLIIFKAPQIWDGGKGFDYKKDIWIDGKSYLSEDGSNWFNSRTNVKWANSGIYKREFLEEEYEKFNLGDESVILKKIPFDIGNENIDIDFTDIVNSLMNVDDSENTGFCLCFSPVYELEERDTKQYIGFFTNNTNSFFEPFLETTYTDPIRDDRANFYINKVNRLYFYSNIAGNPTMLLENPICTITGSYENGTEFEMTPEVKIGGKGVYYVDVLLNSNNGDGLCINSNRMFYDTWSNIKFLDCNTNTEISLNDVELEFVTKPFADFYNFGSGDMLPKQYKPTIIGINYDEKIIRGNGEIRKCFVDFRIPYTVNQSQILDGMEYQIYVKMDNNREIVVVDWQKINKGFTNNYFLIDVDSFLPNNNYNIRIKTISNLEIKTHDCLKFQITNKLEEIYS
ncbi:MAG: hypothetical protein M0R03_18890 [Novosphingobium sp.]|nr:hypothetical protein [Novosphingobium sp.]